MQRIWREAFGPADRLVAEEAADLRAGPGQVRIAVEAAGVHLIDTSIRSGEQKGAFPLPELPMVPGREVAGVVDEVGTDVEPSWVGRRVVAHLGNANGGYASQAVADVASLHPVPDDVDLDVAVATIGTGRTVVGVLGVAELRPDDVVLVTSAAGGMGTLLVQAAHGAGATVAGVAGGPTKVALVAEQGADVAVDYLAPDWDDEVRAQLDGRPLTVVLDGVGGDVATRAAGLLGRGGRIVVHGWSSGVEGVATDDELAERGITSTMALGPRMFQGPDGPRSLRDLEERALAEVAAGRLRPVVGARFPLADAAAAHRALEARETTGKVVLVP